MNLCKDDGFHAGGDYCGETTVLVLMEGGVGVGC